MVKHPNRILWTAIIVAWTFDFLFWEKSPGTSFAIFVGITLGAGLYLARVENQQLAGVYLQGGVYPHLGLPADRGNFSAARVYQNEYGHWWVMVNEEHRPCQVSLFDYD
ncbi:MAG: hypothetical protein MUO62_13020 [Anaerolineales bacterium]|nr:hypothetical protein [Anaerolineales bacterium]